MKKTGKLKYDHVSQRFQIVDGENIIDSGFHCGECLEICLNDIWIPTRMEMNLNREWYLVGIPGQGKDLENFDVRTD